MEVAQKARKEDKVRYLGFTGHTDPAVHLDMLDRYDWDAVMMSMNVVDAHWHSFQNLVLPRVLEKNIGVLAFKTLAGRARTRPRLHGERGPALHLVAAGVGADFRNETSPTSWRPTWSWR